MIGLHSEQFSRSRRGKRRRTGVGRPLLYRAVEFCSSEFASQFVVAVRRRGAEAPDAPAPAILKRRVVLPATPPAQPVPVTAVDALRVDQEPKAGPGQATYRRHGEGFSCGNDEDSGHIVGAVAEPSPGLAVTGVLESAPIVRHSAEVVELGLHRACHTNAGSLLRRRFARCTYEPATTDQHMLGATRDASAAMRSASPGSTSTRRSADTRAAGSSRSTMMPAPLANNSTAWGNAVATTGRPAAMAAASTPEVTWSVES